MPGASSGNGDKPANAPNPMTGPFFIEGAAPGDTLEMRILRMTANRDSGWTFTPVAPHVVDPGAVRGLPARERVIWKLDRAGGPAHLQAPPPALKDFAAPFKPMIGCFGVAPTLGPGALDGDKRTQRRQHGLSPLRAGNDGVFPGRG